MTTANPYTPPRAEVLDVHGTAAEFQPTKVWSARGRIGRLRYLCYPMVGYWLMAMALVPARLVGENLFSFLALFLVLPWLVLVMLSTIQRSHDMGWSGWTSLLALIPLVGLVWVFNPGTPGPNRFGAPPSPNTLGVKLGAFLLPLIAVIGILAAIALPAYQQYTQKAKAAQVQVQPK